MQSRYNSVLWGENVSRSFSFPYFHPFYIHYLQERSLLFLHVYVGEIGRLEVEFEDKGMEMGNRERARTNTSSNPLRNTINSNTHGAIEYRTDRLAEIHGAEGGFGVGCSGAASVVVIGLDCVDGAAFDLVLEFDKNGGEGGWVRLP